MASGHGYDLGDTCQLSYVTIYGEIELSKISRFHVIFFNVYYTNHEERG